MASWANRVIGAAKLSAATYEEVEADKSANFQAMGVVLLSAAAGGVSMMNRGAVGIAVGVVTGLVGWVIWSGLTWFIGTKIFPTPETRSDIGELLRTTGFAAAPGMIRVLGAFPVVGFFFTLVAWLWTWAAFAVAVRQALDYRSTWRALLVCGIGGLVWFSVVAWTFFLLGASVVGLQALQGKV